MKRFSYIFILFFAYFVCVFDVYADNFQFRCRLVDNTVPGVLTAAGCPFIGTVRNNTYYLGVGPNGQSNYTDVYYSEYNTQKGTFVNNYNLFGYYNDGNLVGYTRPYDADTWSSDPGLKFSRQNEIYTDNNGNVEYYIFSENTEYVDVSFSSSVPGWNNNLSPFGLNRLDFAVHVNLTNIPQSIRNNILGNFVLQPTMVNNPGSYCTAQYDNDIIRISCSFDYQGEEIVVRLNQYNSSEKNFNNSVQSYTYYGYFDISEFTIIYTSNDNPDDLDTYDSPNRDIFNDYYNFTPRTGDKYFSGLSVETYSSINSLGSIITAPLRTINNIKGCNNNIMACNIPAQTFTIFNEEISLLNGYQTFWGKCAGISNCHPSRRLSDSIIRGHTVTAREKADMLKTFKDFWNVLFGGYIIYLLAKRIVKVTANLFDPDKLGLEVF